MRTQEWGGKALWSFGTNKSRGVAILLRAGLVLEETEITASIDSDGRFVKWIMTIDGCKQNFVNVYCPNSENERVQFIESLVMLLEKDIENTMYYWWGFQLCIR